MKDGRVRVVVVTRLERHAGYQLVEVHLMAGRVEERLGCVGRVDEDDGHVLASLIIRYVRGKVNIT